MPLPAPPPQEHLPLCGNEPHLVASNSVNVSSYSSRGPKTKMGFTGLKSRCWQVGLSPFWRLQGENVFSCLFHLLDVAGWPCSLSSRPEASSNPSLPPFTCEEKDPCDYIDHIQIIQGSLPISISLIPSPKSLLPYKVTYS